MQKAEEASAIVDLFGSVFSAAEGEEEGRRIEDLVRKLQAETDSRNVFGYVAVDGDTIVGAIMLSRLTFDRPVAAFLLSPVAVEPAHQRRGIGQALISHGLADLKSRGAEFVATYGDPAFYSRVGFRPVSAQVVRPPYPLSQPRGWLGQSLSEKPLDEFEGRVSCVASFEDPALW